MTVVPPPRAANLCFYTILLRVTQFHVQDLLCSHINFVRTKDAYLTTVQLSPNLFNLSICLQRHIKFVTYLRMVPTIVTAHTFCASPDTQISYRQCLLIQGYFCAV